MRSYHHQEVFWYKLKTMDQMESVGWISARMLQFGTDVGTITSGICAILHEDIMYHEEVTTTRRFFGTS